MFSIQCLLIVLFFNHAFGNSAVPVFFWSPETPMSELPEVNMNDVLEPATFNGEFLKPLMEKSSHSAIVFLQDKLHMDDFTKYADVYSVDSTGGAFKNIKSLMENSFSLELPQVARASESIAQLASSFPEGSVHAVTSAEEMDGLDLNPEASFLLVVRLATAGLDEEAALAKNDEIIGSVCHKLTKRGLKYTALFTGQEARQGFVEQGSSVMGRHLLAEEDNNNGTLYNITSEGTSNMFMYMKTMKICVAKARGQKVCDLQFDIELKEDSAAASDKKNGTAVFDLSFPGVKANNDTGTEFDVNIVFDVVDQKDRWVVKSIVLKVVPTSSTANVTEIKNGSLVGLDLDWKVPALYSFHCTQLKLFLDTVRDAGEYKDYLGTYVMITGFQFQPFNIQQDRFFNSVDCVPFFTSGILMGLFPSLLLLSILLGGAMMLLSLSIMDKYDDPKGKTISVNTGGD